MKMFNYSADKMRDITEYVNSHGIKHFCREWLGWVILCWF